MKLHILKIIDCDDHLCDPMYFTIKGLREQVLNEWYDIWCERFTDTPQTKEEIETDDEKLFDFMNDKGFGVETILTITEKDFI